MRQPEQLSAVLIEEILDRVLMMRLSLHQVPSVLVRWWDAGKTAGIQQAAYFADAHPLSHSLAEARATADYWYLRCHYTDAELTAMYLRASKGLDEEGNWTGEQQGVKFPAPPRIDPYLHPGHPGQLLLTAPWMTRKEDNDNA